MKKARLFRQRVQETLWNRELF